MRFDEFLSLLPKIKKLPLPGRPSQFKMAPVERIKELREVDIAMRNPRQAAVLAMCYPDKAGAATMAFILRKTYEGVHSNQVGFPGGKVEPEDENLEATALRETHEEVGVHPSKISVVKSLTNIYIPPSNFWVQSYLGYTTQRPAFVLQEDEVEDLLEVPVKSIISPKSLITKELSTSYMTDVEVPAFLLNNHVVWGATAMMLSEIKDLLLKA